jgi:hypothetical protein
MPMFLSKRLVVAISLATAANSAPAQNPDQSLPPSENALPERIADIRETPNNVSVRGSAVQPDGRTTSLLVGCFVSDRPRFNALFTGTAHRP